MPYPIAELAYGLRRRLHDLATVAERYDIQIAAGDYSICPPIQMLDRYRVNNVFLNYEDDTIKVTPDVETDGLLYRISTVFCARLQNCPSVPFDHFCDQKILLMANCHLSKTLFEELSSLLSASIQEVHMNSNSNVEYVLKMSDLLTSFPNLTKISATALSFADTWMVEILQYPQHNLTDLTLRMTFEQFKALNVGELVAFLLAYKKGFHLTLQIVQSTENDSLQLDLPNVPSFTLSRRYDFERASNPNLQQYDSNTRLVVQSYSTWDGYVWFFEDVHPAA
uniref:F-box domain-containing protein n=1 Tax=Panagrellus redivivus TaxID=6233 RepID=A0A7E4ZYJ9_PANRE